MIGACCDQLAAPPVCSDMVAGLLCTPPKRFVENEMCANLDPPCGYGACCNPNGSCTLTLPADCIAPNTWQGDKTCAEANCPPCNDVCADWQCPRPFPTTGGPPYIFVGRNNGSTSDPVACHALGPTAWEGFTLTECLDLVIDYCGTFPVFTATPSDKLFADCTCDPATARTAVWMGRNVRIGACCLDDPPGYDSNYALIFENVPPGDWYYPVLNKTGSSGDYHLNVTSNGTCTEPGEDCNTNGLADENEVVAGSAPDCNTNGVPDECECGDYNGDGLVGHRDFARFQSCFSGPVVGSPPLAPPPPTDCLCILDADADGDLDLQDFWRFQQCSRLPLYDCATCPVGAYQETGDTNCGLPEDTDNGGCFMSTPAFETTLTCDQRFCGTFATSNGLDSSRRDTDWYQFDLTQDSKLTWLMTAEAPIELSILNADCVRPSGYTRIGNQVCPPEPVSMDFLLPAGSYYLVVAPQVSKDVICGFGYTAELTCTAATVPTGACCPVSQACTNGVTEFECIVFGGEYQGDGTDCAPNPCLALPLSDSCASSNGIFGPGLNADAFTTAATSQMDTSQNLDRSVFDNFWALSQRITGVVWWGLEYFFNGTSWVPCTRTDTFNIRFYADVGGDPAATPTYSYNGVTPAVVDSGVTFGSDPIWEYTYILPAPISMSFGWVELQGADTGQDCWFLWVNNTDPNSGDQMALQVDNATGASDTLDYDMALCIQGEPYPCAALGCTPTEGEGNCSDDYVDNTNNGCSGYPGGAVFGAVSCGATLCGHTGNYTSNGTRACLTDADCPGSSERCDTGVGRCESVERDRDWFELTLTEMRTLTWIAQVGDATAPADPHTPGLTAQIWGLPYAPSGPCWDMTNLAAASNNTDCAPVTVQATVPPGTYGLTVFGKTVTSGTPAVPIPVVDYQPCDTEWEAMLTCTAPDRWIGSPADTCDLAPTIPGSAGYSGSGFWSGTLIKPPFNWEGAANCQAACPDAGTYCPCPGQESPPGSGNYYSCGFSLNSASAADVWWRYIAPCTGRVTFSACGWDATGMVNGPSDIDSIIGVYTGNCGALAPAACGGGFDTADHDCNATDQGKPKVTADVTQGATYYVQLLTAGQYGIVTLDVSECVTPCP